MSDLNTNGWIKGIDFLDFLKAIDERKKGTTIIVLKKPNMNATNSRKELDVHAMIFIGI
jgi:polynucleotide 5'-kinase involved in rRNA processing